MKKTILATASACALMIPALPSYAGDAEAGATAFGAQCVNCHNIVNDEGELLAGRANMRSGPNLYGVVGRAPGSLDGFRYGASLVEVGKMMEWTEEAIAVYLGNPGSFLQETLDNRRARSQMSFRVGNEETARDIAAYLATFSEVDEEEAAESD